MTSVVVLASGRGSNFSAILEATRSGVLAAEILGVISDQPDAPVLGKAEKAGISTWAIPAPERRPGLTVSDRRQVHEAKILEVLEKLSPRFLVLAGYMRIMTTGMIKAFQSDRGYARIVNIHPSLLPSFPGLRGYAQAYQYGVKVTGATVHLVESEVDCGPICAQAPFSIADCRSESEVEQRGLQVENQLYPETLQWILPEKFAIERRLEGRFCVCPN